MFRRVEDFKTIWQQEAEKTLAVFAAIPDAAAHQAVDAQHRDLRRMAWHLVETVLEHCRLDRRTTPIEVQEKLRKRLREAIAHHRRPAVDLLPGGGLRHGPVRRRCRSDLQRQGPVPHRRQRGHFRP